MSVDRHLLPSQRREVEALLLRSGLPITDFSWDTQDAEWAGLYSEQTPVLVHRPSNYRCAIAYRSPHVDSTGYGGSSNGGHQLRLTPGEHSLYEETEPMPWEAILPKIADWIRYIGRELGVSISLGDSKQTNSTFTAARAEQALDDRMSEQKTKPSLAALVARGRELLDEDQPVHAHSAFMYWVDAVADWLDERAPESGLSAVWSGLQSSSLVSGGGYYDYPEHWQAFRRAVTSRLAWLGQTAPKISGGSTSISGPPSVAASRRVFVVHGRNEAIRETTARLLERLKLEPIILHEQPNRGQTIIEKFVDFADVAFAVVLLTGDDRGGHSSSQENSYLPRARQNVLLELGFFLGKLGRERVCALYEEGVEVPSDYSGVLFIPLDSAGHWRLLLARELKAVGLPVDLNLIL